MGEIMTTTSQLRAALLAADPQGEREVFACLYGLPYVDRRIKKVIAAEIPRKGVYMSLGPPVESNKR